jgi:deazaflavin-dependent oxidoreductase (nitroreductase family)
VTNLRAAPTASITVRRATHPVRAQFVSGATEHARLWQQAVGLNPGYRDYLTTLTRPVPIVRLVVTAGRTPRLDVALRWLDGCAVSGPVG